MNGAAFFAALAFGLTLIGGLPLLFLALLIGAAWFAWMVFRKQPEPESNGWCPRLQEELEKERRQQT
ncbi:MAG: hypothetical protein Q4D82_07345 [Neisseria sp.]|nr:hypothetical protein [Neisseria sp.]